MKQLKKDLQALSKELGKLGQMAGRMMEEIDKIEKTKAVQTSTAKTAKKTRTVNAKKMSASATVLTIIAKSKKGVDTDTLIKETGFDKRKLWSIVYRLKTEGKIKSGGYGLYVKV